MYCNQAIISAIAGIIIIITNFILLFSPEGQEFKDSYGFAGIALFFILLIFYGISVYLWINAIDYLCTSKKPVHQMSVVFMVIVSIFIAIRDVLYVANSF